MKLIVIPKQDAWKIKYLPDRTIHSTLPPAKLAGLIKTMGITGEVAMTNKVGISINAFGVDHKAGEKRITELVEDGDAIVDEGAETVLDSAIKKVLMGAPKPLTTEELDYQLQLNGTEHRLGELKAALFRLYNTKIINRVTKGKYWKAYWSITPAREQKRLRRAHKNF
jgi:hypothetical protein